MNLKTIFVILLGGVVVAAIFFLGNNDHSQVSFHSLKTPKWKLKKGSKASGKVDVETSQDPETSRQGEAEDSTAEKVLDPTRGLCFFTKNSQEKFLPFSLIEHLRAASPGALLLPAIHGECLKETETADFGIVDYDPESDVAFNFFGKIRLSIKLEQEFSSYEELVRAEPESFKKYGFKDAKGMASFFADQGYHRFLNQGLISFLLTDSSRPQPRTKSAVFDVYPGVEFISLSEARQRSNATILTMLNPSEIFPLTLTGINDQFPRLNIRKIEPPERARLALTPKLLSALPKEKEVIILGQHRNDQRPLSVATALYGLGHKKVSVISGGIYESNGLRVETPDSVVGLKTLSENEFLSALGKNFVIDTRRAQLISPYQIQGSYSVPYFFPSGMNFSHQFFQKFGSGDLSIKPFLKPERFLSLDNLKMFLGGKSVLVVGANEYDWSPIVIGLYIKQNIKTNVSWFRAGFDRIENLHKLLLLSSEELSAARVMISNQWQEKKMGESEEKNVIFLTNPNRPSAELMPRLNQRGSP